MSEFFDDEPEPVPPGPPARRSRALLWTALIIAALFIAFSGFSAFWTERLWFGSVGFEEVFTTLVVTKVLLFVVFGVLMGAAVGVNCWLAFRMRPLFQMPSPDQAGLDRYRDAVSGVRRWLLLGFSALVGVFAGASGAGQWRSYLMWRHGGSFGTKDPYLGKDVGFYVFDLPWLHYLVDMVMVVTLVSLVAATVVHYLFGGIQLQHKGDRFSSGAQAQLSALVGVFLLAKAADYWLDRFDLLTAKHSLFTGVNFTAHNAVLPSRNIMIGIAVICALLFFANVWRRTWLLPTVGLGLMVLSAVLIGMIWPGIVQRFQVSPSEADKEQAYIGTNIAATRTAYNLADSKETPYAGIPTLPDAQLAKAAIDHPGVRLVDPKVVQPSFEQFQQIRGYYTTAPVLDVDRYDIPPGAGKAPVERDLVLGVRELDQDGLPENSKNWANLHTVYTHGYGVIAAYGNQRPANNITQVKGDQPAWAETDIPPRGQLTDLSPDGYEGRIYFGEKSPDYSVVGKAAPDSRNVELDLPLGSDSSNADAESTFTYDGAAGVPIDSLFNQLIFAARFGDANLVLSERVHANSKILYHRDPREMVEKVAPWLTIDEDPYPAVVDGRVLWILDGFTTTNRYPQSELDSFQDMTNDALAQNTAFQTLPTDEINYVRNSVKATVDAYDGTVTLYAWDDSDPILKAWEAAFPDTVKPRADIPADVLAHMRYPEDMFKAQRYQLASYHVTDPTDFYERNDQWAVPVDPDTPTTQQPPYRLTVETPGGNGPTFSLTSVYVPAKKSNLAAFVSVDAAADQPGYGTIRILRLDSTEQIAGPGQIAAQIEADPAVKDALQSFRLGNSKVLNGNLLTLPVGGGLLYVQPIYVQRTAGEGSYPVLTYVAASFGRDDVGIGETFAEAINNVLHLTPSSAGSGPPGSSSGGQGNSQGNGQGNGQGKPSGTKAEQIQHLLTRADALFRQADEALRSQDLQTYADKVAKARQLVDRALSLANAS